MQEVYDDSPKIKVRINGEEYDVAERTAAVDKKLQIHNEKLDSMSSYEASYDLVKILLGDDAVKKIFTKGDNENLTFMYKVARAVDEAYQTEYNEMKDKEYEETLAKLDKLAARSKPVIDMIDRSGYANKKRR